MFVDFGILWVYLKYFNEIMNLRICKNIYNLWNFVFMNLIDLIVYFVL